MRGTKKNSSSKGFTLIETIISITILAVAIIGPMTLSSQSIRASRDSRLHLEAVHLAEEGVEIIHNMRDNVSSNDTTANRLVSTTWINASTCATGCVVDATSHNGGPTQIWSSGSLNPANTGTSVLCYDSNDGLYSPASGGGNCSGTGVVVSPFRRIVTTASPSLHQMRITSVVSYTSTYGGRMHYATATSDIYNWYPCTLAAGCP